jgi:hypothetical protein
LEFRGEGEALKTVIRKRDRVKKTELLAMIDHLRESRLVQFGKIPRFVRDGNLLDCHFGSI